MIAVTIGAGNGFKEFGQWSAKYVEKYLGLKTYVIGEEFLKYAVSPGWEMDMAQKASCIKFLLFDIFPGADRIMFFDADWRPVRKFDINDIAPDSSKLYFARDEGYVQPLEEAYELPKGRYFNAGWFIASRKHHYDLFKECYDSYDKFQTKYFDQCIMNQVFNDKVTLADPRINVKLDLSRQGGWATENDLRNKWTDYCNYDSSEVLGFHSGCNWQIFNNEYSDFEWK